MLNNIKLIGIIFLSVLLLTNCKKENKIDEQSPGELVFAPIDVINDAEKDGDPTFDVLCNEEYVVHHAFVTLERVDIEGNVITNHTPLTFILDNKLYTQSLKLEPGEYIIREFSLMTEGDDIVKSTPMVGSVYAGYVNNPIDDLVDFEIFPFEKEQFEVDVLCFVPAVWDNFGFEWFDVTEITLREQCFFGDICIDDFVAYAGTLYDNPLVNDEVAIFRIEVYRDGYWVEDFYNTNYDEFDVLTYISPLCVQYADYDLVDNTFEFKLFIYTDLGYQYFYTWTFDDDEKIPSNNSDFIPGYDDGVVDFVLGDCVVTPSDLVILP